MRVSLK
ncbi:hypothetical protein CP082626L3_0743A, partial [Chlamydia psittaci 08-2626_L3]